ncbi:MAG TPA: ethanolamine ammonia-lyase reactivating factor EutA, partial [Candidatus Limnocylindria bacterium]|nr:ethanolamine ammonia-lyase reactivating factor EutA [Candidatus Limnocylindria bacterium]
GGKFVCATAGHALEATLAAHGSGSVARSRRDGSTILHVDIGGGTTKLARIENGTIVATSAIAMGARLVAFDAHGAIARLEPAARTFAVRAGVPLALGSRLGAESRRRLAEPMVEALVAAIRGAAVPVELRLLDPLLRSAAPKRITLSGGVSEYLARRERADHLDLGQELAAALDAARPRLGAPLEVVPDGIRATVIGASQFSVQVSGSTIVLTSAAVLPLRNVPVLRLGATLEGNGALALAVKWTGEPEHARIRALAERVVAAAGDRRPLVVAIDGDIAATLGTILRDELGFRGDLITLDGLDLGDLDYIDVGAPVPPSGVVPVVVKSLMFSEGAEPART